MVDAVVLAGGNAKELASVPAKGLVLINGRPMVEYVIDALRRCAGIERICVVLPIEHSFAGLEDEIRVVTAKGSLPRVIRAGIDYLGANKPVLILSADAPLITPEAISDFLDRCSKQKAEFYYPIIRYGESERRFPGVKRTYARVKEGRFTGGNIMLLDPAFIVRNMELVEHVYELRKSPLKLSRVLGLVFLLRFILGRLSIHQIEERIGQLTNSVCTGVITPFIEIGIDVDKRSDLQLAMMAL
ncbi:MAG TPA: nucleotidyltransferase family protein, partial [Anaerolineae bacterium]|nr:nucleotidyltransferase family protein [Anaerolineae bacterium]